jgi:outer membrane beta-barrel protein
MFGSGHCKTGRENSRSKDRYSPSAESVGTCRRGQEIGLNMKTTFSDVAKAILVLSTLVIGAAANAQSDFDSLGSNEAILNRARALNTSQQVRIVQKRAVDRDLRFEIGAAYGGSAGGNSYLNTQPIMGMLEFHVNPRFSFGGRYTAYANQLTKEGQSQMDAARAARDAGQTDYTVSDIDLPKSSLMGTVSYYPMYGKLNFFDLTVVQFDFYVLAGYGTMEMKSGNSATWTAGGGVGFWWNKYVSSRFEIRQQGYQDRVTTFSGVSARDIGLTIGTLGIGILL